MALLDSGAGGIFIDRDYQRELKLPTRPLRNPIIVHNVDGTRNKKGLITDCVKITLDINDRKGTVIAHVTGLGKQRLILGYPWLQDWNPDVDWKLGSLKWRDSEGGSVKTPAGEPSKPKYRDRKHEGQEVARENSGGRPKTFREPAKVALVVQTTDLSDQVEGSSPNEEGMDDLESLMELGYPSEITGLSQETQGSQDWDDDFDIAEEDWIDSVMEQMTDIRSIEIDEDFPENEDLWIYAKNTTSMTFAQKYQDDEELADLAKSVEEKVPPEFHQYLKVFSKEASMRIPVHKDWDHKIDLKPDYEPKAMKAFSLPQDEVKLASEFVHEHLEKGYIRPSESPQASPLFFVNKKDGGKRACIDYRHLNNFTKKKVYPIPIIQDLMDGLQGMKYFTILDVRWGYNNIRIRKGDEWKAAFRTADGLFEPTVMFFGLCNSPATFQSIMDRIFQDEALQGWLKKYIDDILIAAKTKEELKERTLKVLKKLQENDLYLKPEKCKFYQTKIEYLGFIISEGKVEMDPKKIAGIVDWPAPTTLKQLRSFLGFGNFYRRFIRSFSDIARPLNELLRKDVPFVWTSEREKCFNDMKRRFTTKPVLVMPDQTRPFYVEADASKYATGGVLMQKDSNGELHPCSFISQTFSPAERNYQIYDRELLGIIRALTEWRHYILGNPHTTTVFTDHNNLLYYRTAQRLNRRQARWSLILSEYDITLVHQPGPKMIQSDALSRRPDHIPEGDTDNDDIVMLPDSLFVNLIDTDLARRIQSAKDYDPGLQENLWTLLKDLPNEPGEPALGPDWWIDNESAAGPLLVYKGRHYVPNDLQLRRDILWKHHDAPSAGHPGQQGTYHAVSRYYWWPGLRTFVNNYVQGCAECQKYKIDRRPSKPALQPIESSRNTRPFAQCSMDLITGLPPSDGFNAILVVVDHGLTKGVILAPTVDTSDSETTAILLHNNLFKRFGLPDKFISDRDPRFASKAFQELLKLLGIESAMSTAYHPQTDGATERVNQEIEAYLAIYCAQFPEDWPKALPSLEFTHNSRRHADNKRTPFEMIMGFQPIAIPTSHEQTDYPSVLERFRLLAQYREEALAAHEIARNRIAQRINANYTPFKLGQQVWLDTRNLKMRVNSKMKPRKEGPFKIKRVIGKVNYELDLPIHWKVHPVFHATLLKPFKETEQHGPSHTPPPPDILNDEEQYEVERIMGHRTRGRKMQYLIRWKGYTAMDDSWEPEENLENAPDILKRYQQDQIDKRTNKTKRGK